MVFEHFLLSKKIKLLWDGILLHKSIWSVYKTKYLWMLSIIYSHNYFLAFVLTIPRIYQAIRPFWFDGNTNPPPEPPFNFHPILIKYALKFRWKFSLFGFHRLHHQLRFLFALHRLRYQLLHHFWWAAPLSLGILNE